MGANDPFAYVNRDFDAWVSGSVGDTRIEAEVQWRRGNGEIGDRLCVRFACPEALNGLTATLDDDGGGAVRLGDAVYESGVAAGAALPFFSLLGRGEKASVLKNENGELEVSVRNGDDRILYVFSKDGGIPKKLIGEISGTAIDFDIKNTEFLQ